MKQRPKSAVQRLPEIALQRPTSADSAVRLKDKLPYEIAILSPNVFNVEEKLVSGAQFRSIIKGINHFLNRYNYQK